MRNSNSSFRNLETSYTHQLRIPIIRTKLNTEIDAPIWLMRAMIGCVYYVFENLEACYINYSGLKLSQPTFDNYYNTRKRIWTFVIISLTLISYFGYSSLIGHSSPILNIKINLFSFRMSSSHQCKVLNKY